MADTPAKKLTGLDDLYWKSIPSYGDAPDVGGQAKKLVGLDDTSWGNIAAYADAPAGRFAGSQSPLPTPGSAGACAPELPLILCN